MSYIGINSKCSYITTKKGHILRIFIKLAIAVSRPTPFKSLQNKRYRKKLQRKMKRIEKQKTWEFINLPQEKLLGDKWSTSQLQFEGSL